MKNYSLKIIIFILFNALYFKGYNQNTNISSFTFKSNYKSVFNSELIDTIGKYGSNEFGFGLTIPVYTHFFKTKEDKSGFYDISIQSNNGIISQNIEFINKTNTLLNLNIGMKALYFNARKNIWLSKLSLNFFEDQYSISEPHPRFSGLLLFNRIVNPDFAFHLGLTYHYSFGIAAILPVAGLKYDFANRWKFLLSLPFYGSIQYKVNEKIQLILNTHPAGAISYYSNNTAIFTQAPLTLLFRKRANTFAMNILYKIYPNLSIKGSIGREANRKIYFSDLKSTINKAPTNYFSSGINSVFFINFELIFKLGKHLNTSKVNDDLLEYLEDSF
ncbi:MAG: DUF6268 family outer membrane beta-barrel protein [Bacteroidales bacterium]